jgi:hypothetical protein
LCNPEDGTQFQVTAVPTKQSESYISSALLSQHQLVPPDKSNEKPLTVKLKWQRSGSRKKKDLEETTFKVIASDKIPVGVALGTGSETQAPARTEESMKGSRKHRTDDIPVVEIKSDRDDDNSGSESNESSPHSSAASHNSSSGGSSTPLFSRDRATPRFSRSRTRG